MKGIDDEYERLRKKEEAEMERALRAMAGDDASNAVLAFNRYKRATLELELCLVQRHNAMLKRKTEMTGRFEAILRNAGTKS